MNRLLNGVLSIVMAVILVGVGVFMLTMGVGRLRALNTGKFVETQATVTRTKELLDPPRTPANRRGQRDRPTAH